MWWWFIMRAVWLFMWKLFVLWFLFGITYDLLGTPWFWEEEPPKLDPATVDEFILLNFISTKPRVSWRFEESDAPPPLLFSLVLVWRLEANPPPIVCFTGHWTDILVAGPDSVISGFYMNRYYIEILPLVLSEFNPLSGCWIIFLMRVFPEAPWPEAAAAWKFAVRLTPPADDCVLN